MNEQRRAWLQQQGWFKRAADIAARMHSEASAPVLEKDAILVLADRLCELHGKKQINDKLRSRASLKEVRKELEAIKGSLRRLSSFNADPTRSASVARNILGKSTYEDELGNQYSVTKWLETTSAIQAALKTILAELDNRHSEDDVAAEFLEAHGMEYSTVLMGSELPKLFETVYPGLAFGGRTAAQNLQGKGYTFVQFAMEALDGKTPKFETILSSRKRVELQEGTDCEEG